MMHAAFNFNDHTVQLRLLAIAAAILCIICLCAWEYSKHIDKRRGVILGALMTFSILIIGYVLAALGGVF